jgi:diaminopimelate epimerase
MTTQIAFTKMHGIGNDFVILDNITQSIKVTSALVRRIANRHVGIGCDQVLVVEAPMDSSYDFNYRIFNADGVEVSQCGNGARCLGRYVYDRGLTDKTSLLIGTLAGPLKVDISDLLDIKVDMGTPIFSPKELN